MARVRSTPILVALMTCMVTACAGVASIVARDGAVDYYLEIGAASGDGTKVFRARAPLP